MATFTLVKIMGHALTCTRSLKLVAHESANGALDASPGQRPGTQTIEIASPEGAAYRPGPPEKSRGRIQIAQMARTTWTTAVIASHHTITTKDLAGAPSITPTARIQM